MHVLEALRALSLGSPLCTSAVAAVNINADVSNELEGAVQQFVTEHILNNTSPAYDDKNKKGTSKKLIAFSYNGNKVAVLEHIYPNEVQNIVTETHIANFVYALSTLPEIQAIQTRVLFVNNNQTWTFHANNVSQQSVMLRQVYTRYTRSLLTETARDVTALQTYTWTKCFTFYTKLIPIAEIPVNSTINWDECENMLTAMHTHDLVHLDIKRDNLCALKVDEVFYIVPIDFGLSVHMSNSNRPTLYPLSKTYRNIRLGTLVPFRIDTYLQIADKQWDHLAPSAFKGIAKLYDRACLHAAKYDVEARCYGPDLSLPSPMREEEFGGLNIQNIMHALLDIQTQPAGPQPRTPPPKRQRQICDGDLDCTEDLSSNSSGSL